MTEPSTQPPDSDPGAPIPDDAIDPELVALRKRSGGISPLLSLSVLVFCGYMMITLRADLRFSREDATPRQVDEPTALIDRAELHDRFVHVRAVPDRAFAAQVATGQSQLGQRVTPVLGSGDRVWLYTDGNPWTAPIAYNERYQGRLRPLDDLPFADGLRAFVRAQPPTPRVVELDALRTALADGAMTIADPAGSPLALAADTPVTLHQIARGRAELIARATADRLDDAAWNLVLANAGVLPAGGRPYRATERAFWYRVPAPDGIDAVRARLRAANLFSVDVRPIVEPRHATWAELVANDIGVEIGSRAVAWADIDRVSVAVRHDVPGQAVVLLTDELPATYWYLLPIYIVMGLFTALFGWALVRAVRRMRPATP